MDKFTLYSEAMKMSLENAEQWIKDAKLLMENSSFGHANAILRVACEELAKAYVCWLTSEKILPIDNRVVKDVFRYHRAKNEIIIGLLGGQWFRSNRLKGELVKRIFELSEEKIIEAFEQFEAMLDSTDEMRWKSLYVDVNEESREIITPLKIDEKETKGVLEVVELILEIVRTCIEEVSEKEKQYWRKVFSSIPDEVWKTGEIPMEWFRKKSRGEKNKSN